MRRVTNSAPVVTKAGLGVLQKAFLGLAAVALVGSVGYRVWSASRHGDAADIGSMHAASFVGGADSPHVSSGDGLERYLPYLTEASLFGIIGFALGYASRKVFKLALLVIAVLFIGVQLLVSTGHVSIDWLGVNSKINEWIFNIKQNESITSFLTNRVPSAGSLLVGYVLGFKRG